ncbi:MAG: methyl-accepting chemotaxis protein [Aquabacterium sp.]|jgi:methyl-accepting chemotaxis protein|uniref:methyl-accepting chemotaxis protein n=1 Tax=Aquabacterium sp. TaxID=1872578 RepID=UPI003BB076BB
MSLLQNLSVRGKLIFAFATVLVLMSLITLLSGVQGARVGERTQALIDVRLSGVRDSLLMAESATRLRTRDYRIGTSEQSELPRLVENLRLNKEEFDKFSKSYESAIADEQERALYNQAMSDWQGYVKVSDVAVQLAQAGDAAGSLSAVQRDGLKAFEKGSLSLKALAEYNDKMANTDGQAVAAMQRASLQGTVGLFVVAFALASLMCYLISRAIANPLELAVQVAKAVADGDLTRETKARGKDEVAQLMDALGQMVARLRTVVSEVRNGVESVSTASSQIAMGNADLSQRTEEQASNLQQTAASMEQLTSTITQNAEAAAQASRLASRASEAARKGGDIVSNVVTTMNDISGSSRQISDIIGVIDGIAFQTNILALNAAVEAARAGEQGRGFAVVAGEVRTLAQRSAQAAKEIKQLIGESVQKVETGVELVSSAGKTMGEIVGEVKRVSDLIGEISAASREQSQGVSQVGDAVQQLDQVTQQNAALVEEAAAAADSMKQQAANLSRVVSVFKVDDHAHHEGTVHVASRQLALAA